MLNINDFISNDYEIQEISNQIFLIKNFVSENERVQLLGIARSFTENDWKRTALAENNLETKGFIEHIELHDKSITIKDSFNLSTRLMSIINKEWNIRPFTTMQRLYPGCDMEDHIDDHPAYNLLFASVLYLNDDYMGGEIKFPKRNLVVKPEKGDLIFFPSIQDCEHGVNKVKDGPTRYVITSYIWEKNK
jgi:hypothetical protein